MSKPIVPFEITLLTRDTCLCLHTQRAARTLARRFDEAFRPVGLTNGQFSLLMSLNRPGAAPMRAVANLLGMDRTTLTGCLKPLERRGLAASAPDPEDRRARLLTLTAAGAETLAVAVPIWIATHRAVEAELRSGAPAQLRADLISLARIA